MKKKNYIVGKWYKCTCNDNYYKFCGFDENGDFNSSEVISPTGLDGFSKGYNNKGRNGHLLSLITECLEDLNEIQKYLPDNHPDKIKPSLVGRYIKALINSPDLGMVKKDEIGIITKQKEDCPDYADFPSQKMYGISKFKYLDGKYYELMPIDYNSNIQTKEQLLLEKAKRLYPIGTKFKRIGSNVIYEVEKYDEKNKNLWLPDNFVIVYVKENTGIGEYLYNKGVWAEIVEDKEVIPKYVEYTDTKYKGKIVKVEDWCCGSYCKVLFYEGIREQPFKELVKPSTEKAYNLQNCKLYQYPLTPEECFNTEIEVGDEVELISNDKKYYTNNYLGQKAIIIKLNSVATGISNINTHWVRLKDSLIDEHWKIKDLKIIKKASQITKQVNFSSPKVTNILYIKPRNQTTVVITEEKRTKLKLNHSKTIKTKQHVN